MVSVELLVGLLIAYVLFYVLVNYFLRYRFGNDDGSHASSASGPRGSTQGVADPDRDGTTDPAAVVCGTCRTENDPGYTYCRSCVSKLSAPSSRSSGSP